MAVLIFIVCSAIYNEPFDYLIGFVGCSSLAGKGCKAILTAPLPTHTDVARR